MALESQRVQLNGIIDETVSLILEANNVDLSTVLKYEIDKDFKKITVTEKVVEETN